MSERKNVSHSIIVPVYRGNKRFRPFNTHVMADVALNGSTMDVRFGVSLIRRGSESKEIWLNGRIQASEICPDLDEIAEVVPCKCLIGNDLIQLPRINPAPITLVEKLDHNSPDSRSACCLRNLAVRHMVKHGSVGITEFARGFEDAEFEFSLTYRVHTLSARVGLDDIFQFVA